MAIPVGEFKTALVSDGGWIPSPLAGYFTGTGVMPFHIDDRLVVWSQNEKLMFELFQYLSDHPRGTWKIDVKDHLGKKSGTYYFKHRGHPFLEPDIGPNNSYSWRLAMTGEEVRKPKVDFHRSDSSSLWVLDWTRLAEIIAKYKPGEIQAFLSTRINSTSGKIWWGGKPYFGDNPVVASREHHPSIRIFMRNQMPSLLNVFTCYRESTGEDENVIWPTDALIILRRLQGGKKIGIASKKIGIAPCCFCGDVADLHPGSDSCFYCTQCKDKLIQNRLVDPRKNVQIERVRLCRAYPTQGSEDMQSTEGR